MPRKKAFKSAKVHWRVAKRLREAAEARQRQRSTMFNGHTLEPMLPVCRIERGSGGDIRYSVSVPGLTADQAREEAQRQYQALVTFVESLKTSTV